MSKQMKPAGRIPQRIASMMAAVLLCTTLQTQAASRFPSSSAALASCSAISVAEPASITLGKSSLIKLPAPVVRLVIGGQGTGHAGQPQDGPIKGEQPRDVQTQARTAAMKTGVADVDVMLLSPRELYLLGKRVGSMNLVLQDQANKCTIMDVSVSMDSASLQAKLAKLMPEEKDITISAAEDSLILSGEVSDAVKLERAMTLAAAYAPEKRVVNLMRTSAVSQVMLEVTVAEISKTVLDQLGVGLNSTSGGSGWVYSILSDFLSNGNGFLQALKLGKGVLRINGEKDDGIARVLAEPNIMAISGQQASFLSGGKIFIPVAQTNAGGVGSTITLEEKEFGVGVKFTPVVLEGQRINLKVASEVSELSQTGSPFTTVGGVTSVLPSFTTRRADTTVQLRDGQSFAIAGLIKNNLTESIKRFPGLGEVPMLGALFRSTEFQKDMTELVFIITPRLVKPLPAAYPLPTDNFNEPGRNEFMFGGKMEGSNNTTGKPPRAASPTSPKAGEATPGKVAPTTGTTAPEISTSKQATVEKSAPLASDANTPEKTLALTSKVGEKP